jgi:hypothetical protein
MPDKFPTTFYQKHGILTCPNGDQLRSDDEGLFCLIDGDRVSATVVNGAVVLPKPAADPKPAVDPKPAAKPKA